MTRLLVGVVLATATVTLGAFQQVQVFRSEGETVRVFVTVTDKQNRLVTNLTQDDFQVLDNGKLQPITLFDNRPQPIHLILMLDVSVSMWDQLKTMRTASGILFDRLRDDDLVRVLTFGNEVWIRPSSFTRDSTLLRAALPTKDPSDSTTLLWEGIGQAMTALRSAPSRPVILVLSDGKNADTGSNNRRDDHLRLMERAEREDVMVYSVGLQSTPAQILPRKSLPNRALGTQAPPKPQSNRPNPAFGEVALATGGGYLELAPKADVSAAFSRVVDELHSQYLVGFSPPAKDGRSHNLEVKLAPKDLKARARKTYQAPSQ